MADDTSAPRGTARITVTRSEPDDTSQREIYVSLDGQELAILQYRDSVTREVPAGAHRLRAHNTLMWKTLDLDLQPGEHARFRVINKAGWGTYSLMVWLGAGLLYLTFERVADDGATVEATS
ncbi:MAG: hypothetical protein HOP14_00325 [Acidobacteria bacterium]|nr:hypothetical protein [Acidobacteriota bacterium]